MDVAHRRATGDSVQERPDLHDNLSAIITFPQGGFATLTQTLAVYEYHLRGEVVGTDGAIRTWWLSGLDRTEQPRFAFEYFDGTTKHDLPLASTPGELFELETEIRHVAHCIATGAQPLVGAEAGAPVTLRAPAV